VTSGAAGGWRHRQPLAHDCRGGAGRPERLHGRQLGERFEDPDGWRAGRPRSGGRSRSAGGCACAQLVDHGLAPALRSRRRASTAAPGSTDSRAAWLPEPARPDRHGIPAPPAPAPDAPRRWPPAAAEQQHGQSEQGHALAPPTTSPRRSATVALGLEILRAAQLDPLRRRRRQRLDREGAAIDQARRAGSTSAALVKEYSLSSGLGGDREQVGGGRQARARIWLIWIWASPGSESTSSGR